jgi:hypothetical protein
MTPNRTISALSRTSHAENALVTPLVGQAEAVVCAVGDPDKVVGPLDASPHKNVSPPIGALSPTVLKNRVVLKSLRVDGTGTVACEKFDG